jgi:hypothetical protein
MDGFASKGFVVAVMLWMDIIQMTEAALAASQPRRSTNFKFQRIWLKLLNDLINFRE